MVVKHNTYITIYPTTLVLHKSSGESAALTAHKECNKFEPFERKERYLIFYSR